MAKKKALPVQHGEGDPETVSLPPAAATALRELQGAVRRAYRQETLVVRHSKLRAARTGPRTSHGESW